MATFFILQVVIIKDFIIVYFWPVCRVASRAYTAYRTTATTA